jgi:hypothetical protein
MNDIVRPGRGLIFMKIGVHAQEPIEKIIDRKMREYRDAGVIFWGYGGNTCHPRTIVQPFAKEHAHRGNEIVLVMHKMTSKHDVEPTLAKEYSDDGVNWHPVPAGVNVAGSRYALVLDQLQLVEFDINLQDLTVAMGACRGTEASKYIHGRVDKGCFEVKEAQAHPAVEMKHIDLYARLKEPYAVFLR